MCLPLTGWGALLLTAPSPSRVGDRAGAAADRAVGSVRDVWGEPRSPGSQGGKGLNCILVLLRGGVRERGY